MAPPPPTDETTSSADHLFYADSDSDSDSGYDSDDLTDVQLGLSDGPLEAEDESNPLVSRIGGRVAWLPTKTLPPASTSACPNCSQPMELLLQIFAPLEGSAYDRLLLIWGCARAACQRQKKPSIRAVRILQHNKRWAAKLEKQKAKAEAREAKKAEREAAIAKRKAEEQARAKQNPFAASGGANKATPGGGLGGALFGGSAAPSATAPANPFAPKTPTPAPATKTDDADEATDDEEESDVEDDDEDDERLAEETAIKASLTESASERAKSDWAPTAPAYLPAQYLNTIPEPSSAARAASKKLTAAELKAIKATDGSAVAGDTAGLQELEKESYERMMVTGVDATFEHFLQRVKFEGRQVVRYRFGGEPLAFNASGETYEMLWPAKRKADAAQGTPVTRAHLGNSTTTTMGSREYDGSAIPPCPSCGAARTFEAQLMPNLINLLRPKLINDAKGEAAEEKASETTGETAEQRRRREIEEVLGRPLPQQPDQDGITRTKPDATIKAGIDGNKKVGLNFGTAMVFVCEQDCVRNGFEDGARQTEEEDDGESWREEFVAVQWED